MSAAVSVCGLARPALKVRASADGANGAKKAIIAPKQTPLYLGGAARGSNLTRAIQVDTSAQAAQAATQDPLMLRAIRGEDVERPPIWCDFRAMPYREQL